MVPVVGSALSYVPLSIILFANGETAKGFILIIYGLVIMGSVDNIFRFWLQRKIGDVHPLITVFGVIIGVPLFGFIGLIFGPLLISLFILLMRIYHVEFIAQEEEISLP
jgi:predicted PurR-regulated permease PerM